MPVETEFTPSTYTPIRAPRGTQLTCKSWQQEAAMRMLMNNLDEEVAERPKDLVVYGGTGRAARSWAADHAIVATLTRPRQHGAPLARGGHAVSGGTARAARSWEASPSIGATLKKFEDKETRLVQSGKPVAVFKTHDHEPR